MIVKNIAKFTVELPRLSDSIGPVLIQPGASVEMHPEYLKNETIASWLLPASNLLIEEAAPKVEKPAEKPSKKDKE